MNRQILRRIILAGLFIIPFIPFFVSSSLFFPFITTKAFAWRMIVEIIFAAWIILAFLAQEYRPKRSPILYAVLTFLFIVGLADLFGVEPVKSFWSNFERMEGYITMLHLGAFFLVMGSVFKEREWKWWWNTTLAASAVMILYCIFQLLGAIEIHQGGVRVDGTLGNAAYLALYFLIHIFITIFFFIRAKTSGLRWTYGILLFFQVMILYNTATRGAILGLLGGLVIMAILNVTNRENERIRKMSRYLLGALIILVVVFFFARNTAFVKQSLVLERFASLSLSSVKTEGRAFVWPMAVEGIKERPILGWGQENFNYVFAEHYSAKMHRLEPWFDRAHNIFLDWGIAAGVLGLLSYLSLYIVLLISIWRGSSFSRAERSVLTGLLAAYFFNNLFVFDNLISYILFFSLLAFAYSLAKPESAAKGEGNTRSAAAVAAVTVIALPFVFYFVNMKPIIANTNLISALTSLRLSDKSEAIDRFEKAHDASRLGRPEVVEWVANSAAEIFPDESVPMPERASYFLFAKDSIDRTAKELEADPRYEIIAGMFYANTGYPDEAMAHFLRARDVMPEKQIIHFNIGNILYQKQDFKGALAAFKHAYDLDPTYGEAKRLYEAALKEIPNQ